MKRSIILPCVVTAFVALSPSGVALADNPHMTPDNPNSTGQPSQNLDNQPSHQHGFDTAGFANAEAHYANPDSTGGTHSLNPHVVSQYDVAAFQFSHRGPGN